ncbi:MAG: ROK family protein [Cyclobacteriaceae bacterium]
MQVLGIDIGGTGMKGAVVDTIRGELVTDRHRIPTPSPATPKEMINTVKEIVEHFEWEGPIGCGFPAAIKHDIVMTASNIDDSWIGVKAAKKIKKKTGCRTHLVNDVDAAGLAEMSFGAGKGNNGTVLMIAAGTGIGTALFTEGELVPNTELGHIPLHGASAEKYAANSVRKKLGLSIEEWAGRFNEYLALVEFLLWPDLIILGGGISKQSDKFLSLLDTKCEIVPAQMLNNAGIIGAAVGAQKLGLH